MAASGKNVSAETFSDGRSSVESHELHEPREPREPREPHEPHEPDRPPLKPLRVRRATALAQIAEHYLATRSRGANATPLRSSDAYQVFVHVNANDAHPDNRINGGHTHLCGRPPLSGAPRGAATGLRCVPPHGSGERTRGGPQHRAAFAHRTVAHRTRLADTRRRVPLPGLQPASLD